MSTNPKISAPKQKLAVVPALPVPSRTVLLAISFFEGAAVMVVELLGAKMYNPATPLYVVLGLAALLTLVVLQQKLRYDDLFPFASFTGETFAPVPTVQLADAAVLIDDKPKSMSKFLLPDNQALMNLALQKMHVVHYARNFLSSQNHKSLIISS